MPIATFSAAGGSVRESQAATHVVSNGMDAPCTARIAISTAKFGVSAQTTPAAAVTQAPTIISRRVA